MRAIYSMPIFLIYFALILRVQCGDSDVENVEDDEGYVNFTDFQLNDVLNTDQGKTLSKPGALRFTIEGSDFLSLEWDLHNQIELTASKDLAEMPELRIKVTLNAADYPRTMEDVTPPSSGSTTLLFDFDDGVEGASSCTIWFAGNTASAEELKSGSNSGVQPSK